MNIEYYAFGHITIDDKRYDKDVIIVPQKVWGHWWRQESHNLAVADLEKVFEACPEILIVGTGFFGLMQVSDETRQEIERQGIELQVLPTRDAWKVYNQFSAAERKVAAAFHLTC